MADTLTKEQLKFLEECEKEFSNRFTNEDEKFKSVCEKPVNPPPIIDPWYNKSKRYFNWSRQRGSGTGESSEANRRDSGGSHRRNQDQRRYRPYRTPYHNY